MKKVSKLIMLFVALLAVMVFAPTEVEAYTRTGLKETIDEEISIFGEYEEYSSYVDVLKNADLTNYVESSDKVNVYVFRGASCSHCLDAITYFASIVGEYGNYFNLITYETWENSENNELMSQVGNCVGSTISGVPFIMIGEKTFDGFSESAMADEIISTIMDEYQKAPEERVDIVSNVENGTCPIEKSNSEDIILLLVFILIIVIIVLAIIARRKMNVNEDTYGREVEEEKKEVKVTAKKEETKKTTTEKKTTKTAKAKQTTKKTSKK